MRRRRSPGNPRDLPGLNFEEATYGCVRKRECTLTKCRMNVSTLGVSSQKKTDPVEVTLGPDPIDKAEAWKGDRTLDDSIVSGPGMSLAGLQCHLAQPRPQKGKAAGSAALKLGPRMPWS